MKKIILLIMILSQVVLVNAETILKKKDNIKEIKKENIQEEVLFSKCMDGDTAKFIINDEEKTVRFLAINAPELEHEEQGIKEERFGKEASNYTCESLTNAKKIVLEYDSNSDKEDKFGRVLAFIYVDNELLEEKLVKEGLAKVAYVYDDYAHVDDLRKVEEEAKKNKRGIWSEEENSVIKEDSDEDNILVSIVTKIVDFAIEIIKKIFALF